MTQITTRRRLPADVFARMTSCPPLPNLLLAIALLGCAASGPAPGEDATAGAAWKERTSRFAGRASRGAARGAQVVGSSLATAVHGVRTGFEEPDAATFGAYPKHYVETVRGHLLRFEGVPRDASLRIHPPQRGVINRGLLRGGGVEWQGYLVDVEVSTRRFTGQRLERHYVVRLRDGQVIEVHDRETASALRRVETPSPAAPRD